MMTVTLKAVNYDYWWNIKFRTSDIFTPHYLSQPVSVYHRDIFHFILKLNFHEKLENFSGWSIRTIQLRNTGAGIKMLNRISRKLHLIVVLQLQIRFFTFQNSEKIMRSIDIFFKPVAWWGFWFRHLFYSATVFPYICSYALWSAKNAYLHRSLEKH